MIPQSFIEKMPFIIKPDNIAKYKNHKVYILDRRIYPFEISFVECVDYEEVARAIEGMVTQSLGPAYAAGYGMALAAEEFWGTRDYLKNMERAGQRLINTRPTNHEIRETITDIIAHLDNNYPHDSSGPEPRQLILDYMDNRIEKRHNASLVLGRFGASIIKNNSTILTHCWPETTLIYSLIEALNQDKKIEAYTSETRPFLQGARLTASALIDLEIPVTVITDNMVGSLFANKKIDLFLTGSDRITMSGHVINKVGTMQAAYLAKAFNVPFYAFGYGPDLEANKPEDVVIEERNPAEVLSFMGRQVAHPKASGWYPAFDVTPPDLVTGIITDKGIFSPYKVKEYYK